MKCCDEPGCKRHQPMLVLRSSMARAPRFFAVTQWRPNDNRGGLVAQVKHDVTPSVRALLAEAFEQGRGKGPRAKNPYKEQ